MKLTKISLAALVALGAFSTVASATPLEDAIKNVDVSGYLRYRYDNETQKAGEDKASTGKANFKSLVNFKAALDDNFFAGVGLRYAKSDEIGQHKNDMTYTKDTFGVQHFYLGYKIANTTVVAGKQEIGTFFTDDAIGTGIKVLNSDVPGLTLAAVAFGALELDGDWDGGIKEEFIDAHPNYRLGNLYGVAAIGSYDPVSFQLWYATLEKVVDLIGVEASGDFALNDDVKFVLKGQFVNSHAKGKLKEYSNNGYGNGNFYAFEASTEAFGADLSLGYIGWKVKTHNGHDTVTSFSLEDQGGLIDVGEENYDYTWMTGKGGEFFVTAGYTFEQFHAGVDYRNGKTKFAGTDTKEKQQEIVGRLGYDYSKKLKFSSFYSVATVKNADGVKDAPKETKKHFRFEAKYFF